MIRIQKKEVIFDTNKSRATLFRSEKGDFIRFNLFPAIGKESLVSSLDELRVFAKVSPNEPGFASKSNIQRSTLAPVSVQFEIKKSEFTESQTLGYTSVIKPTLSQIKFYVPGKISDSYLFQKVDQVQGYTLTESLLGSIQKEGSVSNPGRLVARVAREQTARRGIPITIELDSFVSENQKIIIQIIGIKSQSTLCSQVISIPSLNFLSTSQITQRITALNFSRADRSKIRFTAYVEEKTRNTSVVFVYRIWSESQKYNNRLQQTSASVNLSSRSASISVTCTEKEYVEVYAFATDGSGRVCGQPVRTLVTPVHRQEDLDSIVLRSKDLSGISGEALGIPDGATRIKVVRKNLDTKFEETLGFFPVVDNRAIFSDSQITEQLYPSFSTRLSYEVHIEKMGSLTKSSHSLDVDSNLINDSYGFSPVFSQENGTLAVSMSPSTKESALDLLTKDLNSKSLTDAFSSEILQVRSQTSERFLYDVYTVSESSGEQNYVGEFREDSFSLKVSKNQSVFILPKTSSPRQQISATKKLIQQPQLVSKSRVSRVSDRSLSPSLDSSIIIDDGVKPKIYNQKSLIDGIISDSQSSKVSNLTGHVYSYSTIDSEATTVKISSTSAFRTGSQNNIVSWSCSIGTEFSHFVIGLTLETGASVQLCRIPIQRNLSKYQFVDPVGGKIPGSILYSITPIRSDQTESPPALVRVDIEEVQIA